MKGRTADIAPVSPPSRPLNVQMQRAARPEHRWHALHVDPGAKRAKEFGVAQAKLGDKERRSGSGEPNRRPPLKLCIMYRLAERGVVPFDVLVSGPAQRPIAGQFRAIIRDDDRSRRPNSKQSGTDTRHSLLKLSIMLKAGTGAHWPTDP